MMQADTWVCLFVYIYLITLYTIIRKTPTKTKVVN